MTLRKCVMSAIAVGLFGGSVHAEEWRSLDDVKKMVVERAGKRGSFAEVKRGDVEQILSNIKTLDRDEWAREWCRTGLKYEGEGDALVKSNAPRKEIAETYLLAFNYCMLGRYPVATSPGKKEAYLHSVRQYRKAGEYSDPPLKIVEIPFEGKKLVGYLRLPPNVDKPPVVMNWGGVDGWKEDRERPNQRLLKQGIATFTVDLPGTGESPVLYGDPAAQRGYSAFIDHLAGRADLDGSRIAVWGGSFGGYWAARLAYTEASRIRGAVFQGGSVHLGYERKWLVPAFTTGGATYLFGAGSLLEARNAAMGLKTMDEFLDAAPKLSLVSLGLIDKPSAPILGVNGKLDDQAPVEDIYFLMEHGSPKEARIYPKGFHMGATPGLPEDEIGNMITDWLKQKLKK